MKSFSTAAKNAEQKDESVGADVSFEFDGRTVLALAPTSAQMAVFLAAFSDQSGFGDSVAGIINFFHSLFERQDAVYFKRRLLDKNDPFDISDVTAILEYLIEEWSGHPTQPPSVSYPSESLGGPRLTGGQQDVVSTRSAFGLTDS